MTWGTHGHIAIIGPGASVLRLNLDPENYVPLNPVRRASRHQIIGGSQIVQDFGLALVDNEISFSVKVNQAVAKALDTLRRAADPTYTIKDWAGHEFSVFFVECSMSPRIEYVWGPTRMAQGGGSSTIILDAASIDLDDFYNDANIRLVSGPGSGEGRRITDYVGASRIATVHLPWVVQPTSSTGYQMADVIHEVSVRFWVLNTVKLFAEAV